MVGTDTNPLHWNLHASEFWTNTSHTLIRGQLMRLFESVRWLQFPIQVWTEHTSINVVTVHPLWGNEYSKKCFYPFTEEPPFTSSEGCSDHEVDLQESESSLSKFSCTPQYSPGSVSTNSEVGGDKNQEPASAPDWIVMNMPFDIEAIPSTSTGSLVAPQCEVPFPLTPEQEELVPDPIIAKGSYQSAKDSLYFREIMARKKTTQKLPKNWPKNTLGGTKVPQKGIDLKPLKKTGTLTGGVKPARNEIRNMTAAGTKASHRNTGGSVHGLKVPCHCWLHT